MELKIALLIIVVSVSNLLATPTYSQVAKVSLDMENRSLEQVMDEIEKQSEFYFIFNQKQIDVNRIVDVKAEGKLITEILPELFAGTNVNYAVFDRKILLTTDPLEGDLLEMSMKADIQQKIVTGTVTEKGNMPLPGATVLVKGTMIGTTTDVDGNYSISVPADATTLQFSFLGYELREVVIGNQTVINVELVSGTVAMGEVIVTALGIQREEKALGYAVQKVSGDIVSTVKGVDLGTSLSGKIAGLMVRNSSEFATEPEVFIRGEKPLLVIDGVPYGNVSLRDLPSDDIENISVLKGSTASALYGYRGAAGAIMVTTKKGSSKKGLSVSVNSSTLFSAGYLAIPEMQSEYGRVVSTSTNIYAQTGDGSWGVPLDGREVIQWDPISKTMKAMPYLPIGKDNFKNFLEQGFILNNNVNVVQQGEYGSFRASASSVENKGQYPNSMFNKMTYSMSGEMKVDKFTFSTGMSYNKQTSPNLGFSGYTGYDPMYQMLIWAAPDWDVRDYKDYWLVPNEVQNSSYKSTNNNPYFDRYERLHTLNRDVINVNLALSYDITTWLKATLRSGYDTYSDRQEVRISKGSFQGGGTSTVIAGGTQIWGESARGSYNTGLGRGFSLNNDFMLTGDKKFGDINVEGLIGGTLFFTQDEGIEARTQGGLSIPGFYSLKASVNPAVVNSRIYRQQVNSLFGRLALSWKSLVYAEGTLRNDWSSTLPESTRSYLYPSVSGSFIASELLPEMNWLSLWKLRGSWTSSKTPASVYNINSVYSIVNNDWGSLSTASLPTTIRGTDVLPESSSTFEIGTVVNFYNNRASVDLSYYSKRMYDFLKSASISPTSGYYYNFINIDEEITRKGFEVAVNATPVKTDDLQWDISLNWSTYARYYTKLDSVYSSDKPWVKVGERYDHYVLRDYQRDPDGNIIHNNGLPLYSGYDSKFGNYDPDWIWGVSSNLRYKRFMLNISLDGRVGGIAQTTTEMYMWRAGSHPGTVVEARYLDATVGGSNYIGDGVKVVSGTVSYDTYGNITSDDRVFAPNDIPQTYKNYINSLHKGTAWGGSPSPLDAYSTTFFKIREVSLTYDLPENVYRKLSTQGISVSVIGQNVFLWARQFRYSDPDGGSENFLDPSVRYLGFNVKVNF